MEHRFPSGDIELVGELLRPKAAARRVPGLVLCHGMPTMGGDVLERSSLPDLATRICERLGWVVLTFRFRGCEPSGGEFSLQGWLDDVSAATDVLHAQDDVTSVWAAGFGTGGSMSIAAAATNARLAGVAALAAPADFDDWAENPDELLEHAREVGAVHPERNPVDFAGWTSELARIRAYDLAADIAPRPLLVVHGADDQMVPVLDAREICDRHGSAELVLIGGAGHGLRDDPRAVATLLGWLDRQAQFLELTSLDAT